MGILSFFKKKEEDKENIKSDLVVFTRSDIPQSTFSEFYSLDICPKCHRILNHDKARYKSRCCYKCGYTNGGLFSCKKVIVRDRYVDGGYIETVVHKYKD